MKKFYYLILLCLMAGAAAAQEVTVTNLQVKANNEITFNVAWNATGRDEPWSDTVWVFVDYFNMDKQQMWRLPVSSATLTNASRVETRVRMIAGNNAGFYIESNANGTSAFTASVSVTPAGDYPAGVLRPCVYVTDYPPTAEYNMDANGTITANLTGTAPFSGQYGDGSPWTLTSGSTLSITNGNAIKAFVDATGSPGIIDNPLFDTGRICGDFKAGIVGNGNNNCVAFNAGRIGK